MALIASLVMFLHHPCSVALAGRTLGMRFSSLHIVDARKACVPTTGQCARRALAFMLSLVTGGLGILYSLFDAEGRTLHDLLSGTARVRNRRASLFVFTPESVSLCANLFKASTDERAVDWRSVGGAAACASGATVGQGLPTIAQPARGGLPHGRRPLPSALRRPRAPAPAHVCAHRARA